MTDFSGRTRVTPPSSSLLNHPRVRPAYAIDDIPISTVVAVVTNLIGIAFGYGLMSGRLRSLEETVREMRAKMFNGINLQIGALQQGLGEVRAICHARHEEKK